MSSSDFLARGNVSSLLPVAAAAVFSASRRGLAKAIATSESLRLPEMALTIWTVASTVFLPLGIFLLSLLLSGFETLEKLAQRMCDHHFAFGKRLKVSIPIFITLILAIAFSSEWLSLLRLLRQKDNYDALHPLDFNAQFRAQQWRHQRNWWIALFNMLLWLAVARAAVLMRYLRNKIALVEKEKIEILKRVAEEVGSSAELRGEAAASRAKQRKTNTSRNPQLETEMANWD